MYGVQLKKGYIDTDEDGVCNNAIDSLSWAYLIFRFLTNFNKDVSEIQIYRREQTKNFERWLF